MSRLGVGQTIRFLGGFTLLFVLFAVGCHDLPDQVGRFGKVHRGVVTTEPPITISAEQQKKKEMAERMDKKGLLYSGRVVVDEDPRMLNVPAAVAAFAGTKFVMAQEPPRVEFSIVPVDPLFLARVACLKGRKLTSLQLFLRTIGWY